MAQIKGFTVELDGNTMKLQNALKGVQKPIGQLKTKLREVENAMRFDKYNPELIAQKQKYLNQAINETKNKLSQLKKYQEEAKTAMANGTEGAEEAYDRLTREIALCEEELRQFNRQAAESSNLAIMGQRLTDVGNNLTDLGSKMSMASLAAGALVASLGAITYKAAVAADDLNTMSKIYSISTEELQKYAYAADLVDVSVETIAKSHIKLEKSMNTAKKGTGDAAEAYKNLGINIIDASGNLRDADTVWNETIKALGKMENETQRDAYALTLMGKSAAELNPLIEDGGETFEKIAKMMDKYDLDFVDQETLDKANEFNDLIDSMKLLGGVALANIGSNLSADLAPALEKVVNLFGKITKKIGNMSPKFVVFIGILGSLVAIAAPVTSALGYMFTGIGSFIGVLAKAPAAITAFGKALLGLSANPAVLVIAGIVAVGAALVLLYKNCETFRNGVNDIIEDIKPVLSELWESLKEAWTKIQPALATLKDAIVAMWEAIQPILTAIWEAVQPLIENIYNLYMDRLSGLPSMIEKGAGIIGGSIMILAGLIEYFTGVFTDDMDLIEKGITDMKAGFEQTAAELPPTIQEFLGMTETHINDAGNTFGGGGGKLGDSLVKGAESKSSSLPTKIKNVVQKAATAAKGVSFTTVGSGMVTGIISGITSNASTLFSHLKSLATRALKAAQKAIDSHSPSKKFRDLVGKPMVQGMTVGVEEEAPNLLSSIRNLATNSIDAAKVASDVEMQSNVGQMQTVNTTGTNIVQLNSMLEEYLPRLLAASDKAILLDGKKLVGGTINEVNRQLGTIGQRQGRTVMA